LRGWGGVKRKRWKLFLVGKSRSGEKESVQSAASKNTQEKGKMGIEKRRKGTKAVGLHQFQSCVSKGGKFQRGGGQKFKRLGGGKKKKNIRLQVSVYHKKLSDNIGSLWEKYRDRS